MTIEKSTTMQQLPVSAQLAINHCNLPASIIGSLTFNEHPAPLVLDGVNELHKNLFYHLENQTSRSSRRNVFFNYMNAHFQLNNLIQMGQNDKLKFNRKKINYKRIILGWHMNPNGYEAAVLKRWVESRFGLSPRFHKNIIRDFNDLNYQSYLHESALGIYNTNAIEAQLDVLYYYGQYELSLLGEKHISLYRGFNQLNKHEIINKNGKSITVLLNNINSFTSNTELAESFGDYVIQTKVPIYKIMCYSDILPKQINSEQEYIVIGGIYEAELI